MRISRALILHLRKMSINPSAQAITKSIPIYPTASVAKKQKKKEEEEEKEKETASSSSHPQAPQYTRGALSRSDLHASPLAQFQRWFAAAQREGVHEPETVTLSTAQLPSGRVSARMVYLKGLELDLDLDPQQEPEAEASASDPGPERSPPSPPAPNSSAASSRVRKPGRGGGFVVYSNWDTSRKAADIRSNPRSALTFWWHEMERQVRVEGAAERLTQDESQAYFDTRIRGSRLGAWASRQSEVLKPLKTEHGEGDARRDDDDDDDGRAELDRRVKEVEERFHGVDRIPVPPFWGGLRVVPEVVEFWQGRPSRLHDRFRYTRVERQGHEEAMSWKIERLSP